MIECWSRVIFKVGHVTLTGDVEKPPLTIERATSLMKDAFRVSAEREICTGDKIHLVIAERGKPIRQMHLPLREDWASFELQSDMLSIGFLWKLLIWCYCLDSWNITQNISNRESLVSRIYAIFHRGPHRMVIVHWLSIRGSGHQRYFSSHNEPVSLFLTVFVKCNFDRCDYLLVVKYSNRASHL